SAWKQKQLAARARERRSGTDSEEAVRHVRKGRAWRPRTDQPDEPGARGAGASISNIQLDLVIPGNSGADIDDRRNVWRYLISREPAYDRNRHPYGPRRDSGRRDTDGAHGIGEADGVRNWRGPAVGVGRVARARLAAPASGDVRCRPVSWRCRRC